MSSSRTLYLERLEDRTALSADLHAVLAADVGTRAGHANKSDHNHPIRPAADQSLIRVLEVTTPAAVTAEVRPSVVPLAVTPVSETPTFAPAHETTTPTTLTTSSDPGIYLALTAVTPVATGITKRTESARLERETSPVTATDSRPLDTSPMRAESPVRKDLATESNTEGDTEPLAEMLPSWRAWTGGNRHALAEPVLDADAFAHEVQAVVLGEWHDFGAVSALGSDGLRQSSAALPVGYLPAEDAPAESADRDDFFAASDHRSTVASLLLDLRIPVTPSADPVILALTPLTRQLFDQLRQDMLLAAKKILTDAQYREFSRALQTRQEEGTTESPDQGTPAPTGEDGGTGTPEG